MQPIWLYRASICAFVQGFGVVGLVAYARPNERHWELAQKRDKTAGGHPVTWKPLFGLPSESSEHDADPEGPVNSSGVAQKHAA